MLDFTQSFELVGPQSGEHLQSRKRRVRRTSICGNSHKRALTAPRAAADIPESVPAENDGGAVDIDEARTDRAAGDLSRSRLRPGDARAAERQTGHRGVRGVQIVAPNSISASFSRPQAPCLEPKAVATQLLRPLPQPGSGTCRLDIVAQAAQPSQDTDDISVQDGCGFVECDAANGAGGVALDAGQLEHLGKTTGKKPIGTRRHDPGRAQQVLRARR